MAKRLPPDAFDFYLGLGTSRSYDAVAAHYGVSKRAVTKRAARDHWQERIAEVEAKARQAADEKAAETLEAMSTRHLKALKIVQAKALETLRAMSLDSAMDAVRALEMSIKNERLIRGEPGERTAVSVEDVIKREYERWMVPENEDGDADSDSESGAAEQGEVLPRPGLSASRRTG